MKTHIPLFACLLLTLALATNAFALASDLKEPGLAFPENFPESVRTNITAALTRPDCTFQGGHYINWITTLQYNGETLALNLFLEGLVKCPGATVSVRFHSDSIAAGCDWMVTHSADDPTRLAVHVNLKSPRLNLEKLVIPESHGPPLPESEKPIHQSPFPPASSQKGPPLK